MAASAGPALKRLHERYGHRVTFLTIYVREAHPGANIPQPSSFDEKMALARAYARRDGIPWPVAVDDLDGTVHRAFGTMPDAVYLVDATGRIAYRVLWSNDEKGLVRGLERLHATTRRPLGERRATLLPILRSLRAVPRVVREAGRPAGWDLVKVFLVPAAILTLATVGARRLATIKFGS